jgi:hypothetical protein
MLSLAISQRQRYSFDIVLVLLMWRAAAAADNLAQSGTQTGQKQDKSDKVTHYTRASQQDTMTPHTRIVIPE